MADTENGKVSSLEQRLASAWRDLAPDRAGPERVEAVTKPALETTVFRLIGLGEANDAVIAKRCKRSTALVESTIYEAILPRLSVPMLHYYGCTKDREGEFYWLFVEDVGGKHYEPRIREHRIAAGRWMGLMNTSAVNIPAARRLPGRGPEYYLDLLQSARGMVLSNLANPALNNDDLGVLAGVIAHLDRLEEGWDHLSALCKDMPQTLVHGDFISKNVGVRRNGDEIVLLPFDWEKAGWGLAAEDISRVDISTYWETVQGRWSGLGLAFLERLAHVGRIFRCLVFVNWLAPSLAHETVEQTMNDVRRCETWLTALIPAVVWKR